jgi:aspartate racemase
MAATIGILGGMTAESTVTYYQHIVRRYQQMRGDHGYPRIVIYSVSFQAILDLMNRDDWPGVAAALGGPLERLAAAGADFGVIATNTVHLVFDDLQRRCPIPLLSIVDATATAIEARGLRTVGLLGTRFTMEKPFYAEGLGRRGITSLVPDAGDRDMIHRVIIAARGAQGVVLGCTEIPLLVRPADCGLPLLDTAVIHAEAALARAAASEDVART